MFVFFSDELVVLSSFIILDLSSFFQGFDEVLVSSKDRITAGDGEKNDALEGKAVISTETTSSIFEFLKDVAGEKSSAHYSTIIAFNLTLKAGPSVLIVLGVGPYSDFCQSHYFSFPSTQFAHLHYIALPLTGVHPHYCLCPHSHAATY